jgi:hypothetical protein
MTSEKLCTNLVEAISTFQ